MATSTSVRARNASVLDQLDPKCSDPMVVKQAADTVSEFTRVKMREDGFWRKVLPPITITNDELDRQVDTDLPVRVVDKEPDSPAAISVPFGAMPMSQYILGPRYRVMFDRIMTWKFVKDVDELRTYDMDIRQVLSDNAIKDMLAEEDGKGIACVNSMLLGQNVVIPLTGVAQWKTIKGGISRESWAEMLKIMPSTPMHLEAATALMNNVSAKDFMKFGRDEIGGDIAEEIFQNGFTERKIMGLNVIFTIKRDLVPDNTVFLFATPEKLGKFFLLEDATMYIDRKAFMLEFFAYESIGSSIGNVAGIARCDFIVS